MNLYSFLPVLTALTALSLGLFVYLKNKKSSVNISFALLSFVTFWWQFSWFILFNVTDTVFAFYLVKVGYSGIIFIPVTYFHFVSNFLQIKRKKSVFFYYAIGFASLAVLWISNYFINGFYEYFWGYYPKANFFHPVYLFFLTIIAIHTISLLVVHAKKEKASPIKYNQIKYMLWAAIFYVPASVDFIVNYGVEFYPFGFIFVLSALFIFAYAIRKYNLMGIEVVFKELFAKVASFLSISGVTFLLIILFLRSLGLEFPILSVLISMIAMALIIPLIRTASAVISQKIRPRPDFQAILKDYTEVDIMTQHTSKGLAEVAIKRITDSLRPTVCSLMLLDEDSGFYNVIASSGKDEEIKTIAFKQTNHLILALKNTHQTRLIVKDELDKIFLPEQANLIRRDLEILRCQICIPLILKGELLGLLNLGLKSSGELYTPEEIGFLFVFLTQSAFMMHFLYKVQKIHELETKAEKLAGMTNLLVGFNHEIRNQLFNMQLPITPGVDSFVSSEDLERARQIAQESSNTIIMILDSVQDYHENCEVTSTVSADVKMLIEQALAKLKPKFDKVKVSITCDLVKDLPRIEAYPTFSYLFPNLFTNCYFGLSQDAIHTRLLEIKAYRTQDNTKPLEIMVTDTGGEMLRVMKEDTRSSGGEDVPERSKIGGINFFLAKHIIDDHRGELIVTTNPPPGPDELPGTIFTIRLPLTQKQK